MLILVSGFPSLQEGFPVDWWETGNSTDGSTARVTTSFLHLLYKAEQSLRALQEPGDS